MRISRVRRNGYFRRSPPKTSCLTFKSALLRLLLLVLFIPLASAQESPRRKGILALYWYGRDFPSNIVFDDSLRAAFNSDQSGTVEYYPEYLESNRFPGEDQSLVLRDYLRHKYADRQIAVIFALSNPPLNFLLKHRRELFPNVPIVFQTIKRPDLTDQASEPGVTGVVFDNAYSKTFDLILKAHPDTKQVFIITGTPERDKALEIEVRKDLEEYESRVTLTYLNDQTFDELIKRVKSAPQGSIILYIRHSLDGPGMTLSPSEVLVLIAQSSSVPIYGIADSFVGDGIVGGSVISTQASTGKVAEILLRVANGERAQDIPVAVIPTVPTFDSRQLRRWGIKEGQLPRGSIIRFKEPTVWEQYKWRIIGITSLCFLQAGLIVALLINNAKRRRAEEEKTRFAEKVEADHERLEHLSGRLLRLQDEEHQRIAAELHDGLGQSLAIIKNRALMGMRDETNKVQIAEQFKEIVATANSSILEVRTIAHNLRPYELDRLGLIAAIESMLERVSTSTSIIISKDMDSIEGLLSSEAETSVYRIIQEGLNNVVKHSKATTARIVIKKNLKQLIISVSDNGKGMPGAALGSNGAMAGGFGLAGIAERVRLLGGLFSVDSQPTKGTTLTVELELHNVATA